MDFTDEDIEAFKNKIGKPDECVDIEEEYECCGTGSEIDPMMQWFAYEHLPPHLQEASKVFYDLAYHVVTTTAPGRERSVCLRKLVEAKDAGVRAALNPGA